MSTVSSPEVRAEMAVIKDQIAVQYARRERLKQAVATAPRETRSELWAELESVDVLLSELDTRYKTLWDSQFR